MDKVFRNLKLKPQLSRSMLCLLLLSLGFVLGYTWRDYRRNPPAPSVRENTHEYSFIHPLLASSLGERTSPTRDEEELTKKVEKLISERKSAGELSDASVYFINYKEDGFFGINTDQLYEPASLLKVLIMIGYLKQADENPDVLRKKFTYAPDLLEVFQVGPFDMPSELEVGHSYAVADLIDKMIVSSDNGAMRLLVVHADGDYLARVYTELGLDYSDGRSVFKISTKDYALLFRVLYNGTYLSKANSEKALSILSKTTFQDGLVKGLPENVTISHKYGEWVVGSGDRIESVGLHDCGIIYDTVGPYLLCVMTAGKEIKVQSEVIGEISKMVYEDLNSR